MQISTKLFTNGGSQAVRLPVDFRFSGTEVYIEKQGDVVILRPKQTSMAAWLQQFYTQFETAPEDFLAERDNTPPQARQELE